jgi:ABC-type glycerol-3-phosphate transport system permease component
MAAYVLAKYRFKGNSFLYTVIIVSSVIPTFGAEAATYQLMATLGLNNKLVGMLFLCGGFGGTFLYLHSFFKEIPWSFAESAMIDGASDFRIFLQIMIPLAKNGIMVFAIMIFMGNWNEYWRSYLYYGGRPTLAVGLTAAEASIISKGLPEGVYFAMMTICVVPILIFYAFFANKLMDNLNAGGIKG